MSFALQGHYTTNDSTSPKMTSTTPSHHSFCLLPHHAMKSVGSKIPTTSNQQATTLWSGSTVLSRSMTGAKMARPTATSSSATPHQHHYQRAFVLNFLKSGLNMVFLSNLRYKGLRLGYNYRQSWRKVHILRQLPITSVAIDSHLPFCSICSISDISQTLLYSYAS